MTDIESFAVNRTLEEMKENARKKEMALFRKIKESDVSYDEKKLRWPGIEPGSTAWKAAMLTIIPPTLDDNARFTNNISEHILVLNFKSTEL